jgi:pimeloyl-ACP methyl ester carboxylesterase
MNAPISCFVEGIPRLRYLEWNHAGAQTVVLVHGNSANAWWWQPTARALAGSNLRLLALDLRGHGDSEWVRPPRYSPADYSDDITRLLQTAGTKDVLVVGHSMGGIAALAFALQHHQFVRAVIAIDIALTSGPRRNHYLRRLRTIPTISYPDLPTAKTRFRLMPNEGFISEELLAQIAERSVRRNPDGGYTMKFDRESFSGSDGLDVAAAVQAVRIPLLLVRAERSRIMTAEAAANASRSNQLVELVTIPGAHHHLPLETPRALAHTIQQFALSLEPSSTKSRIHSTGTKT